jgi:ribosome-associated heat shock protein Hsp15
MPEEERMRIDSWLHVARFFKTRGLAARAVDGGSVQLNGARAKRHSEVKSGDAVEVRRGPWRTSVVVRAIGARRGPASEAAQLYEETDVSRRQREALRIQISSMPSRDSGDGRPTKRERRELERLRKDRG